MNNEILARQVVTLLTSNQVVSNSMEGIDKALLVHLTHEPSSQEYFSWWRIYCHYHITVSGCNLGVQIITHIRILLRATLTKVSKLFSSFTRQMLIKYREMVMDALFSFLACGREFAESCYPSDVCRIGPCIDMPVRPINVSS